MGISQALAEANIGRMTRQGDRAEQQRARLIGQNDEIIELLRQQTRALDYLARQKAAERAG